MVAYIFKSGCDDVKCTFFGPADAPSGIGKELEKALVELIEKTEWTCFMWGITETLIVLSDIH